MSDLGDSTQGEGGRSRRATAWARTLALFGIRSAASSQIAAGVNKSREIGVRALVGAGLIGGSLALAAAGTLAVSEDARNKVFAQPDGFGVSQSDIDALRGQVEEVQDQVDRTGAASVDDVKAVGNRADELGGRTEALAEATARLEEAQRAAGSASSSDRAEARAAVLEAQRQVDGTAEALRRSTAALGADLEALAAAGRAEAESREAGDAAVTSEARRQAEALSVELDETAARLDAADDELQAALQATASALRDAIQAESSSRQVADNEEANARAQADMVERGERTDADARESAARAAAIAEEARERANADAALANSLSATQTRLDTLAGEVGDIRTTVTALADRVNGISDRLESIEDKNAEQDERIEAQESEPPVVVGPDPETEARLSALEARPVPAGTSIADVSGRVIPVSQEPVALITTTPITNRKAGVYGIYGSALMAGGAADSTVVLGVSINGLRVQVETYCRVPAGLLHTCYYSGTTAQPTAGTFQATLTAQAAPGQGDVTYRGFAPLSLTRNDAA